MRIKRLILQTLYLQTLKEFYSVMLELPVSSVGRQEICIQVGDTELVFEETTEREPCYHFAINIPCNKIYEARHWLGERMSLMWMQNYEGEIADFVHWHAKSVYFFDPAGNILELIARNDLYNATDEPFNAEQLLNVSEIGLVFPIDEFDKKIENLIQQYQVYYFDKQPPLPQFRAIGTDEGLFIAVPENRNWFPTDKPSEIFPMKIEFEVGERTHELVM